MSNNTGKISQIIGPVIDVIFDNSDTDLPKIYDALEIVKTNGEKMIVECQQLHPQIDVQPCSVRAYATPSFFSARVTMVCVSEAGPMTTEVITLGGTLAESFDCVEGFDIIMADPE